MEKILKASFLWKTLVLGRDVALQKLRIIKEVLFMVEDLKIKYTESMTK